MADERVDVVVAGGGPAGAVAACRLARAGASVLLLERAERDIARVGETLAPGIRPLLVELGAWEQFLALDPMPCHGTASAWGDEHLVRQSYLATPYGQGWHVDRMALDRLLRCLALEAGATIRHGGRLVDVRPVAGHWEVDVAPATGAVQPASNVTATIVVDATGRRALVGRRLGATRRTFDRLTAVAAHVQGQPRDGGVLLVESTPDGWWYRAPVDPSRDAVVLLTDADVCRRRQLGVPSVWRCTLAATRWIADGSVPGGLLWGPRALSAASHRLDRRGDPRPWVAVGDAALAVDPIAGSGVLRALRTGIAGADVALELLGDGPQRGDASALAHHERTLDEEATVHLVERIGFYAAEQRFHTPFWQRRARFAATAQEITGTRPT